MPFELNGVVSSVPLVESREGGRKTAGCSSEWRGWQRWWVVQEGCLDPMATGLHGGEVLDLEAEMARKKNPRTDSATDASTVVNTGVLGLGFKT
jgi:hypothetical protein